MRIILFLSFLVFPLFIAAQGKENPCKAFELLRKEAKEFERKSKFEQALNKYYSAQISSRDCPQVKEDSVKKMIVGLFEKINGLKDKAENAEKAAILSAKTAIEQKNFANKKAIEAQIATNNATSLYWSSEAGKINPIQGLRLLEKALKKTTDTLIQHTIIEEVQSIFNHSNTHKFSEKIVTLFSRQILFSPDGKWLININKRNEALIWKVSDETITNLFKKYEDVESISFSPDGKQLVLFHLEGRRSILETSTWEKVPHLNQEMNVYRIFNSSDDKWTVTTTDKSVLKIWEKATGVTPFFLIPLLKENKIKNMYFSPDSKWIVVQQVNKEYRIWNINSGEELTFLRNELGLSELTFSPDSKWLATTIDGQGVTKLWEVSTGKRFDFINKEKDMIKYITFSSDSKWIVMSYVHKAVLWELSTQKEAEFLSQEKDVGHIFFSPDMKWVGINRGANDMKLFDIATGKVPDFLLNIGSLRGADFSEDSKFVTIRNTDNQIKIFDLQARKLSNILIDERNIREAKFSPDSKWIITKNFEDKQKILNVSTGKFLEYLPKDKWTGIGDFSKNSQWITTYNHSGERKVWKMDAESFSTFLVENNKIKNATFSFDNKWIAVKDENNEIKILESNTGKVPNFLSQERNIVYVKFSDDGKWAVTKNAKDESKVWELASGNVFEFLKQENKLQDFIFSDDTKWLITKNATNQSKVWEVATGKMPEFLKQENDILYATFSPNSKKLMTINFNNESKIWDVNSGNADNIFSNDSKIHYGKFSLNSRWLWTINSSSEYVIWEISTGKMLDFLKRERGINEIIFSTDNKWVVTKNVYRNGRVGGLQSKVWDLRTGKVPDFLKGETNLTDATISNDNSWVITKKANGETKIHDMENLKTISEFSKKEELIRDLFFYPDNKWGANSNLSNEVKFSFLMSNISNNFLKGIHFQYPTFSNDNKWLTVQINHKITTYEIATGKPIQTLWVNKKPTQIQIIDNRYLYVTVGKAIIKMDIQEQRGDFFSYGDGEPLDYTYEEIEEWKEVFAEKYLLPLDEEIKKKYGIVVERSELKTSKK